MYSIVPASGVVSNTPEVNFIGAVFAVAVPALKWSVAVGVVIPIPTLPVDNKSPLIVNILVEKSP